LIHFTFFNQSGTGGTNARTTGGRQINSRIMGRLQNRFITGYFNSLDFSLVMNFSLVGVDFGVGVLGHERITNFFVGLALLILASFGRVVGLFG
jgi:hypothetical protein